MKFTTALVALDMSSMDKHLIQTAYFASRFLSTERIYFVHAIPPLVLSPELKKEFDHLYRGKGSTTAQIKVKLQEEIENLFPVFSAAQITLLTKEGRPFPQLKNWLEEMQPNLLIVGKKNRTEHSGITAIKLARKAKCAIWFVPQNARYWIKRVLVPLDYGAPSIRALKAAIALQQQNKKIEIIPCIVYDIPLPKDFPEDYRQQIRLEQVTYHQKKYEELLNTNHFDSSILEPVYFVENKKYSVSRSILQTVDEIEIDLIIMGATGQASLGSLLFGSVTEKVVSQKGDAGILVIR